MRTSSRGCRDAGVLLPAGRALLGAVFVFVRALVALRGADVALRGADVVLCGAVVALCGAGDAHWDGCIRPARYFHCVCPFSGVMDVKVLSGFTLNWGETSPVLGSNTRTVLLE